MNSSGGVGEKHSRRSSTTSSAATTSSGINSSSNKGQFTGNKVVSPMSSPTSLQSGATPTIAQLQSLLKQQRPLNSSIDDLKSQLQHTNIEFSSYEGGGGDGNSENGENIYDDEVIINPDYHSSEDEEEYEEDEDSSNSNNNSVNNINDPNNKSNASISSAHSCESIAEEEELIASPIQNRHYSFTMGAKDVVIPIGGFASPRTNRSETTVLHHGDESTKQGALTMGGVMLLNPESEKVLNAKDKISSDYKKMMEDLEGFRSEKLKQRKSKYFSKKDLEEIPFHASSGTQLRSTLYQQFMNEKIKMIADNPEKYKVELMKCYKENLKPAPKLQSHGSLSNQSDRLKALQRTRSISQPPVVINGSNGGGGSGGINKSTIGSLESILEKERKRDGIPANPITLPILFTKCIEFLSNEASLKTEGLFRVAGNSSDVEDLLKSILSFGSDIPENCCVHVVSNMLKKFLRQLSIPVFTYKYHNDFIQSMKLNSDEERMKSIKENLKLIPLVNQVLIKELMKFLVKVTEFSSVNMMHAHNLGLMFGPNMLKPPTNGSEMNAISMLDAGNQLITLLIENYNFFYADESN